MQNSLDSPVGKDSAQWAAQLLLQMATSTNNSPGVAVNTTSGGGAPNITTGGSTTQTSPPITTYAGPTYAGLLPNIPFTRLTRAYQLKISLPYLKM